MTAPRITQYGMRLFVHELAATLVEFQATPLDDRDSGWVLRRLRSRIKTKVLNQKLPDSHRFSLVMLFQRLDETCLLGNLRVRYPEDGDCQW